MEDAQQLASRRKFLAGAVAAAGGIALSSVSKLATAQQKVFVDLACSSHNAMWEKNHLLLFKASLDWLTQTSVNGTSNGHAGGAVEDPPLHIESPYRPDPPAPAPTASAPAGSGMVTGGEGLSRMRRVIGERMKQSLDTAATCTTWIEVDMARVEAARAKLGVTALAFVARATIDVK